MELLAKGNLNDKGRVEFKYYIDNNEISEEQYFDLLDDIEEDADKSDLKDEILDDFVNDLEGVICPHCQKEILSDLYDIAYQNGLDDADDDDYYDDEED
jgi:hypothetical protein